MSQLYKINITVEGFDITSQENREKIIDTLKRHWYFEDEDIDTNKYMLWGNGYAQNKENDKAVARRIASAIWKTLEHYVKIKIEMTRLKETRCEAYSFNKKEFNGFKKTKGSEKC